MPRAWALARSVGDRDRDLHGVPKAHALSWDQGVEALAGHVLHDDEVDAVGRFDLVDRDDVRMVQGGGGTCLLHEPPTAALVGHTVGGEHLDRHVPAEARVARAVDLAHPARTQQRDDLEEPSFEPGVRATDFLRMIGGV